MQILIVDDDQVLVEVLKSSLTSQRHVVDTVEDGRMGWEYVRSGKYELVLLDIHLPGMDGVSLCKQMRSEGYTTPILLMTTKNDSSDRIRGLDAGADDYLTKPLDLGELNARIRALSRRGEVAHTSVLTVNGLTLNPITCEVSYQQQPIKLTAKEYNLLEIFLRNPARVFSRAQILDKIWTFDDPPLEESVKAHIKGLRKKLKQAGVVDWIENVYGIGYRLDPKVATSETPTSVVEREFDCKLEQMWLKYQPQMLERLQVLQTATAVIQTAELSTELWNDTARAAHKLAGVLGMFSREIGSQIAHEIETLLGDRQQLNSQQRARFVSLVADLDSLLALDKTTASQTVETPKLLLISQDPQLHREFQQLGQIQGMGCHSIKNIASATAWLQSNSPDLVAIDTEAATNSQEYFSLIADLSSRTPSVPSLVFAPTDSLSHRVSLARAGASSCLVKPTTPTTIWQTVSQLLKYPQTAIASVLIVDDDLVFLAALRSLIEPWGIKVSTLAEPTRFWQVLQATQPDLLILDIEMPKINGIELCQTLRSDPNWQELPILFLTARRDSATIEQVFTVGGDDYIAKPIVAAETIARINHHLDRSRLLHNLATQDRLTGLPNRVQSSRELETSIQQASGDCQFCLAVLQLRELPQINLEFGHATGDCVLEQWGKVFRAAFRDREVTGYWGNGDFVIGFPNANKIQVGDCLAEVLLTLRKQIFTSPEGKRFQVTPNFSVAEFPNDGKTLYSLYRTCVSNNASS